MSLIRYLISRFAQELKFAIVGLINTGISFIIYAILAFYNVNYIIALIISYLVGIISSFMLNSKWTFKTSDKTQIKAILKFVMVYVLNLAINSLLLIILVDYFGGNKILSQLLALVLTTAFSFYGHKYWTFKGDYDK
ncbi:GtrA family protein [Paenibacillus sp. GCM10023248]|uniref:GtrA family protein n=1 Tax=unclassified Paenibacillus TaxID=185978 RepID=UPI00360D8366|nr:GtrA family protein [Paenibacillus sp. MAHUQ-63]